MGAFIALVAAGAFVVLPWHGPVAFVAYCFLLCLLLMAICWVKGERPPWRSGGDKGG